ncbi:MAG: 30S ribosomal protein S2 [Christensenellaceae bacterium]|jgi:small subunit ribosomal protein S2|nr:30S ribosomal protein S2 [Christensenellaceae bacterium]
MSVISIKQLLEAGAHFGHQEARWNPKMKKYIFTSRNKVHILNLEQSAVLIDEAYAFVRDQVKSGKTVLFVGTKKQAEEGIKTEAARCGMFYVNSRWLGGTLTNFETIRSRVERMNKLYNMEKVGEFAYLPKKEVIGLMDERDKLEKNLRGIAEMDRLPGVMVVVDSKKEHIAIGEARRLGIPVVGIIDTNCDPDDVDYIIPVNDDAVRSVNLVLAALADAVIEAKEGVELRKVGADESVDMKEALETKVAQEADAGAEDAEAKKQRPAKKAEVKAEETDAK